jgi:hypothetical protein
MTHTDETILIECYLEYWKCITYSGNELGQGFEGAVATV